MTARRPRAGWLVIVVALLASGALLPAHAVRPHALAGRANRVPVLSGAVVATALHIGGSPVRSGPRLRVERVAVPASVRRTDARAPGSVFVVTIERRFPPRALRYVVTAGGRPVAYGAPTGRHGWLEAVTADPTVLSAHLRVRYGGRAATPWPPATVRPARTPQRAATPGPFDVTRRGYDLGDEVFQPTGLSGKVELTGDVHYPTDLTQGPFPLVLFMHGNHSSCYLNDRSDYVWPCRAGWQPIPNFRGYDYIARRLASYGYIVASVSANGVNVLGNEVGDTGMRQRGEVMERHIDLWKMWNTTGGAPFGSRFVGHVDLSRIGTMGHSRGGEGVVWNVIVDRERTSPYGIDAVLPLAPVDFDRATVNDVPMAVMLPTCDGDVYDLQGVHFFDDARYLQPGDPSPKQTVTVFGANHNFFNTVWSPSGGYPGAFDDGDPHCPDRLSETQQRYVGAAYIVSFFRRYVGGALGQDPVWTGERTPPGIAPRRAALSYLAPDTAPRRLDVDRFTSAGGLMHGEDGGAVHGWSLHRLDWCADTFADPCVPGRFTYNDVHLEGLGRATVGWVHRHGSLRFDLPPGSRDVRGFDVFQFRAALNPGYRVNRGVATQDLSVVLVDGAGAKAQVPASMVGGSALRYPPALHKYYGHIILNQIRFPLRDFSGIDLSDVRSVQLRFTRTDKGVVDIADLAFTRGAN